MIRLGRALSHVRAFADLHGRRLVAFLSAARRAHPTIYAVRIQGRAALDLAKGRIRMVAARDDGAGWEGA